MKKNKYKNMYDKIDRIMGELTPLKADCGKLCDHACCKGDSHTGMRLFPYEESLMNVIETCDGCKMVVCDGTCNRTNRPLACKIFPFFPTISDNGKVFVELDYRAQRLCPMIEHFDDVIFDKRFLKAVKKVGKVLVKDQKCREFLKNSTDEIDIYYKFLVEE